MPAKWKLVGHLVAASMSVGGLVLMAVVNWRVALGVFLWQWGIGFSDRIKEMK